MLKYEFSYVEFFQLRGFTLAEVLITLGIIGVVAAMTIPTLVNNSQKSTALTQYKKAYSEISQAIGSAEAAEGMTDTWNWSTTIDVALTQNFANTYFYPYIKTVKKCDYNISGC